MQIRYMGCTNFFENSPIDVEYVEGDMFEPEFYSRVIAVLK